LQLRRMKVASDSGPARCRRSQGVLEIAPTDCGQILTNRRERREDKEHWGREHYSRFWKTRDRAVAGGDAESAVDIFVIDRDCF
jgi:hypothetical protein